MSDADIVATIAAIAWVIALVLWGALIRGGRSTS